MHDCIEAVNKLEDQTAMADIVGNDEIIIWIRWKAAKKLKGCYSFY